MDLTDTIIPKSDQINADDLMSGPRTFTIEKVVSGSTEQPVNVHLVELPGRPWRPSKSMRRVLVTAWGKEANAYAGRRVQLYRDPTVKFGADDVGGIKISHLSHIPERLKIALTVTRGKRAPHYVDPLPDSTPNTATVSAELLAELNAMFERKGIPEDQRLAGVHKITGGHATDLEVITEDEARQVLATLEQRPDADTKPKSSRTSKPAESDVTDTPLPDDGPDYEPDPTLEPGFGKAGA